MADPSLELVTAILARLRSSPAVTAIVPSASIYPDAAESGAKPPYIVLSDTNLFREDATCVDAQGIFLTIQVWSWGSGEASGAAQARKICDAIIGALHDYPLALASNRLVTLEHRQTQVFKDVDGVKNRGVLEFWASVER